MKTIPLSVTGKKYAGMYEAIVDDEWYDYLIQWSWSITRGGKTFYATRQNHGHIAQMHRVIVEASAGEEVDHADMNGLNNQFYNLRKCTHAENGRNKQVCLTSLSRIKGVDLYRNGKYRAQITVDKKLIHIGYFSNIEDAISARREACLKYHGEYARPD